MELLDTTDPVLIVAETSTMPRSRPRSPVAVPVPDSLDPFLMILQAARFGDRRLLATYMRSGADIDATGKHGETALMMAAAGGDMGAVELILSMRPNPNVDAVDAEGRTALWYAAERGHDDVVNVLLRMGADPTVARVSDGVSALMIAAQRNRVRVFMALLRANRRLLEGRDREGNTALLLAAKEGHDEVLEVLVTVLVAEQDADSVRRQAAEALEMARRFGKDPTILKNLVETKARMGTDVIVEMVPGASQSN